MSEFRGYVGCYVWDLLDEGLERVLDRLAGEVGAQGISLSVALPDVVQLRANPQARPRLLRADAGVFFQPDGSRYRGTRLRPVVSAMIRKSNPLAKIISAARKCGLAVRARIVGTNSRTLVARHPPAACRNVFDDPWPNRLCPSNPDVRAYLCGLIEDLCSNYELEAVELVDFGYPYDLAASPLMQVGRELDDTSLRLLLMCCCPSCRQAAGRAGINTEQCEPAIRESLDAFLRLQDRPKDQSQLPEPLAAYQDFQAGELASLVKEVRSAATRAVVICLALRPPGFVNPPDFKAVVEAGGTVQWLTYPPEPGPAKMLPEFLPERAEFAFPAYPPYINDAEALVRWTGGLTGCSGACFQQYGVFADPVLDWIRRAIRYARREAGPG